MGGGGGYVVVDGNGLLPKGWGEMAKWFEV